MATNNRSAIRHGVAAMLAIGALGVVSAPAAAQVPGVNFYIGAGVGQSDVDLTEDDLGAVDFDAKDMGWKLFAGLRVASVLGAEVQYIDFGKPNGDDAEVDYKGFGAFGLLYAPIPVPVLDLYAKAGFAKVDADVSVTGLGEGTFKDTNFAYGLGAQLKFGSLAIRGEWEQFKVKDSGASVKPSMLSLSFTKSFL
jgi:hypothetical protein